MAYYSKPPKVYAESFDLGAVKTGAFAASRLTINRVDISSGDVTCTLPAAATVSGEIIGIYITATDPANQLTVTGDGAETIDGAANVYLQAAGYCSDFYSDGSNWIWLKKGRAYIDRGDNAADDFTNAAPIAYVDTSVRELDLSSLVPEAAWSNHVEFSLYAGSAAFMLLETGYSNLKSRLYANINNANNGLVAVDSAGKCAYRYSGNSAGLAVSIRGWWVSV